MALCGSLSSLLVTCLGGHFFTEEDVFLDDKGVHCRGGVSRSHIYRWQLMRLVPGVGGAFAHVNCCLVLNWILMFEVTGQSFFVEIRK